MGEGYYYDPPRVEALTRLLEEIARLAQDMTEGFLDEVAKTSDWPGTVGDFAKKGGANQRLEEQFAKDTMLAFVNAVRALVEAILAQIRMVKGTQASHLQEIARAGNRIGTDGFRGEGGSSGRGRHV